MKALAAPPSRSLVVASKCLATGSQIKVCSVQMPFAAKLKVFDGALCQWVTIEILPCHDTIVCVGVVRS